MIKLTNLEYMKKIIKDRLNHLKSELAQAKHQKLDKVINEDHIKELTIRIHENDVLLAKLEKFNKKNS